MQTNHFIFFKKYHTIFIILYIFAFSLLLTGIYQFCKIQEHELSLQNTKTTALSTNDKTSILSINTERTAPASNTESSQQVQSNIAQNILRLHVIAHSDTDADQALKLAVRDEIITSLQNALQNADSTAQAAEIIMARKPQIEAAAYRILARYNSNYSIHVSLGKRYFPIKQYGDLIFPAGTYQALCIEIGKAEGRNWWCVLFPSLCFVDETTATVPEDSKEALKAALTEEEYASLLDNPANDALCSPSADIAQAKNTPAPTTAPDPNTQPEIRFGIVDWFQAHFSD